MSPIGVVVALFGASPSFAEPKLAVVALSGAQEKARAATAEIVAAFEALPGLTVLRPDAVDDAIAARVSPSPRRGWTTKPAQVARVARALGVDLVLAGRVAREGTRDVLVLIMRGPEGRVAAASRVERPAAGLGALAQRMASRMRGLAFASLGLRVPMAKLPEPEGPELVADSRAEDEADGASATAEAPPMPPVPKPAASAPKREVAASRAAIVDPFAAPFFELLVAPQFVSFREGDLSGQGLLLEGRLRVVPSANGRAWTRGLGFDVGVAGTLYANGETRFFEAMPAMFYEWRFAGGSFVEARAGLSHRRVSTTGSLAAQRDSLSSTAFSAGASAQYLGRRLLLRASIGFQPWATEHRFGFLMEAFAGLRWGAIALGLLSRGEVYSGREGELYSLGAALVLPF